ncbi:MAG: 23S rRNA (guanosine(2251)-2'-O)-methyltransferase RlmB, partial [Gammaproteobacteria bacterium]|nr:23S rRNA (guanosine(2251)-2'-O)-methyltransferase RlmB [Gammaproteobacteria bacterium]
MLTIYGRKVVLEALHDANVNVYRLHLAHSNKPARIIEQIIALAEQRGVEIFYKDKSALSRISKNARQDQGIAADLLLEKMRTVEDFSASTPCANARYLVLDRIHNPQNLGMIIRSAAAGGVDALFIPEQGGAAISPLVIKASA